VRCQCVRRGHPPAWRIAPVRAVVGWCSRCCSWGQLGCSAPGTCAGILVQGWRSSTFRKRAYGYRHVERFLSEVAQTGGAETLTDGLAAWATRLWKPTSELDEQTVSVFYLDGHRKPVYSDCLLPRGVIGRTGKVLGCRTLLLLHDEQGHPLLATTHRGDLHLTLGAHSLITRYETVTSETSLQRLVIDREGMAAELPFETGRRRALDRDHPAYRTISRASVLYRPGSVSPGGARSGWANHP
jgi:hypothetical protein